MKLNVFIYVTLRSALSSVSTTTLERYAEEAGAKYLSSPTKPQTVLENDQATCACMALFHWRIK